MSDTVAAPLGSACVPYLRQHHRKRHRRCDSVSRLPAGDMSTAQLSSQIVHFALFVHGGILCTVHGKAHMGWCTQWCRRVSALERRLLRRIPVFVEISTAAPPVPPLSVPFHLHICIYTPSICSSTSTFASNLHHTQHTHIYEYL